jgi:hypothetical protein
VSMSRRGSILITGAVLVAALLARHAVADAKKGREVTVAKGGFTSYSWSLAVKDQHHRRCYELSLSGPSAAGGAAMCEPDRRPHPFFRELLGVSEENATVQLYETKARVHSMRLRIAHPGSGRPSHWTHVRNQRITRRQAHRSGVSRDFRFAVLDSRGNLCVKRAVLFNREGDRIDNRRVSCEF